MTGWHRIALPLLCALGASALCAPAARAAAPGKTMSVQVVDAGVLATPIANFILANPAATVASPAAGLVPAPLPNLDAEAPHGDGARGPSLDPAFFSRKLEFQGNGFARASSQDYGADEKSKPAAGLNLSVPVK